MPLSTYNQIKAEVRDNWSDFIDAKYPEATVGDYADSAVPVYHTQLIQQWSELPYDWRDQWCGALDEDASIIDRVQFDLFTYYSSQFHQAFLELSEELADTEELI